MTKVKAGAPAMESDDLIVRYLPAVLGHVMNHYRSIEAKGNCLAEVADLQQIASVALVEFTQKWDRIAAQYWPDQPSRRAGWDPRFWAVLARELDFTLCGFARGRGAGEPNGPSFNEDLDDESCNEAETRTSLHVRNDRTHWLAIHTALMDFWDLMPRYDKTTLALRYFSGLSPKEIAALVDVPLARVYDHISTARTRWRAHARNQFTDHLEDISPRYPSPWEPPPQLTAWAAGEGQEGLPEYLGHVTRAFRVDIVYLINILAMDNVATGRSQPARRLLSPYQEAQVDKWLAAGMTMTQIARDLGVVRHAVTGYVASGRRAA